MRRPLLDLLELNRSLAAGARWALVLLYLLMLVAIWQGNIGPAFRPFSEVLLSLRKLFLVDRFSRDILESLRLSLSAIGLATALTLALTYLASVPLFRPASFIISKGRFLGLLGIYFIFIVTFGLGFSLKLALLTFGITVFFVTSMYSIVTEIPAANFDYARSLGLSSWGVFWHVVVRGTIAETLDALRQNAAIGWTMIPAVETIVKTGGVGDILWDSIKHFDRGKALAIMFCILTIGVVQDIVLKWLQRLAAPYASAGSR